MNLQSHNTTSRVICNTQCHEKIQQIALTVKWWLGLLRWLVALLEGPPAAGAEDETAPGLQRCVIMDSLSPYLIIWKGESMSTRVPAIMLVLIVLAANQPAVILHKILMAGMLLLKYLFG